MTSLMRLVFASLRWIALTTWAILLMTTAAITLGLGVMYVGLIGLVVLVWYLGSMALWLTRKALTKAESQSGDRRPPDED